MSAHRHALKPLLSPVAWAVLAVAMGALTGPHSCLAQSADTLRGLDIQDVELEITAPLELQDQLDKQVRTRFIKAGHSLRSPRGTLPGRSATLNLTFMVEPLPEVCQAKVLQTLSLSIIEPVVIIRNSVVMRDDTWFAGLEPQVRPPLSPKELEHAVANLLDRFLDDYARANPEPLGAVAQKGGQARPPTPRDLPDARSAAGLFDLSLDQVRLSVLANRSARSLTQRAYDHLAQAGLPLPSDGHKNAAVTLGVELLAQPLGGECPGHVLYEAGLFLVEETHLERAPNVRLWTDTWTRQSVRVVPPLSETQLESDQEALLAEFARAFRSRPPLSPNTY